MTNFKKRVLTLYLIVHCSWTKAHQDFGVEDIRQWHVKGGMLDVGYHYVIRRDGTLETGRPDDVVGAHCKAQGRNRDSIGICLIGGKSDDGGDADNFTEEQKTTLNRLTRSLAIKYPDIKAVKGHRDFDTRTCPCTDYSEADAILQEIKSSRLT